MKRVALLVCLTGLAGCSTDSAHSLSRDYRNLTNEAIDGLMMCTSEARAQFVKTKIISAYQERQMKLDKRFDSWVQNTDDKLIVLDIMDSDSVATLLAEIPINYKRLDYEQQRIAAMVAAHAREVPDVKKDWPVLSEFAAGTGLSIIKNHLKPSDANGRSMHKVASLVFAFKLDKKWTNQLPPDFADVWERLQNRIKGQALGP